MTRVPPQGKGDRSTGTRSLHHRPPPQPAGRSSSRHCRNADKTHRSSHAKRRTQQRTQLGRRTLSSRLERKRPAGRHTHTHTNTHLEAKRGTTRPERADGTPPATTSDARTRARQTLKSGVALRSQPPFPSPLRVRGGNPPAPFLPLSRTRAHYRARPFPSRRGEKNKRKRGTNPAEEQKTGDRKATLRQVNATKKEE